MSKNLNEKIGEMTYDGLITSLDPAVIVQGGTIKGLSAKTTLKRGTILAKSSTDGKLSILGTSGADLTADCVLCDDTEVGTADVVVPVYVAGCFDPDKCSVKDSYTVTEADRTALRQRNIYFKTASDAN